MRVLVGANASGKSNLADAFDFLSEVFRFGLETAVDRKGGYENICFRRERRSKAAIHLGVTATLEGREVNRVGLRGKLLFKHDFEFQAKSEAIGADFRITKETFSIALLPERVAQPFQLQLEELSQLALVLAKVERSGNQASIEFVPPPDTFRRGRMYDIYLERLQTLGKTTELEDTELAAFALSGLFPPLRRFTELLGRVRVYQLSPRGCREPGVPIPNPELDRFGANLPAMVRYLRNRYEDAYGEVLAHLREAVPAIESVEEDYTHRKTLTLYFKEFGVSRSWPVEDISDGTVQILGLLVAMFDPRTALVFIEEPENSVHPWIVQVILKACRDAASSKQLILTTHSPVILDMISPDELGIVSRAHGETALRSATSLDDGIKALWESGKTSLFDYINSGAIPAAVPGLTTD